MGRAFAYPFSDGFTCLGLGGVDKTRGPFFEKGPPRCCASFRFKPLLCHKFGAVALIAVGDHNAYHRFLLIDDLSAQAQLVLAVFPFRRG